MLNIDQIISQTKHLKQVSLPGKKIHHSIMDSAVREAIFKNVNYSGAPQPAAVLALLYPNADKEAHMVFILRKTYKGHHSGQISFPGGKFEVTDKSLQQTALREAYEEIGIETENVQIIRKLTPVFIPVSNFNVTPFLAVCQQPVSFIKDKTEVEKILEIPLQKILLAPLIDIEHDYFGTTYRLKSFDIDGLRIWGATAMILAEIRALLLSVLT